MQDLWSNLIISCIRNEPKYNQTKGALPQNLLQFVQQPHPCSIFLKHATWQRSYRRSGTIVISVVAKDDIVDDEDSARYGHDQALHAHQVFRHVQDADYDDGV